MRQKLFNFNTTIHYTNILVLCFNFQFHHFFEMKHALSLLRKQKTTKITST